jgi:hypothetical protein
MTSNFIDDRHNLYVGWVLGIALLNGLRLAPVVDDLGNYTDRLRLVMPNPDGTFTIDLVVPYPPDDWELYPKGES